MCLRREARLRPLLGLPRCVHGARIAPWGRLEGFLSRAANLRRGKLGITSQAIRSTNLRRGKLGCIRVGQHALRHVGSEPAQLLTTCAGASWDAFASFNMPCGMLGKTAEARTEGWPFRGQPSSGKLAALCPRLLLYRAKPACG